MSNRDFPLPSVADVGTPHGRIVLAERRLRPVLMSEELAAELGPRVEWGEPDADGWYTPTIYRDTSAFTGRSDA